MHYGYTRYMFNREISSFTFRWRLIVRYGQVCFHCERIGLASRNAVIMIAEKVTLCGSRAVSVGLPLCSCNRATAIRHPRKLDFAVSCCNIASWKRANPHRIRRIHATLHCCSEGSAHLSMCVCQIHHFHASTTRLTSFTCQTRPTNAQDA